MVHISRHLPVTSSRVQQNGQREEPNDIPRQAISASHEPANEPADKPELLRLANSGKLNVSNPGSEMNFEGQLKTVTSFLDITINDLDTFLQMQPLDGGRGFRTFKEIVAQKPGESKRLIDELKEKRDFIVDNINNMAIFFQEHDKSNEFQKQLRAKLVKTKLVLNSGIKEEQIIFISREDFIITSLLSGRNMFRDFAGELNFNGLQLNLTDSHGRIGRFAFVLNDLSEATTAFVTAHEVSHLMQPLEALSYYSKGDCFAISVIEGLQMDKEFDLVYEMISGRSKFSKNLKESLVSEIGLKSKLFKSAIEQYRLNCHPYKFDHEFTRTLKTLMDPAIVNSVHSQGPTQLKSTIGNHKYEALKYLFAKLIDFYDATAFIKILRNSIGTAILHSPDSPIVVERVEKYIEELTCKLDDADEKRCNGTDLHSYLSDDKPPLHSYLRRTIGLTPDRLARELYEIARNYISERTNDSVMKEQLSEVFTGEVYKNMKIDKLFKDVFGA